MAAIWLPISERRSWRYLARNLRPQQFKLKTRIVEGAFKSSLVIFGVGRRQLDLSEWTGGATLEGGDVSAIALNLIGVSSFNSPTHSNSCPCS